MLPIIPSILVAFLLAMSFPIAFPPIVIAATNALMKNWILSGMFNSDVSFNAIVALIAPLNTPHISPITSAHILETLLEFRIKFMDSFAPFIFFEAFACISLSSATVTATPIISNITPINITIANISIAGNTDSFDTAMFDMNENIIESVNDSIVTCITHFQLLFFFVFSFILL